MKVIILGCKDYPAFKHATDVGGIETFCNDILPRMNDVEFHVFSRKYKNASNEEKLGNVTVTRLGFINLPLLRTFTFNFLAFFKAKKTKVDLIWAHEPVAGFFAYWISKAVKTPYVLHIHSRGSLEPGNIIRRYGLKFMEKFAYKKPKQVIFVSSGISKDLGRPGVVIPVGIDKEKFKHAKIDDSIDNIKGKKICYIGRLSKVKGVDFLIKAFAKIKEDNITLIIVGNGDERNNLISLAKQLHVEDKVHFLGYKPASSIIPFTDVMVLPSFSEGSPHVILEALVCKKPIVATNVGSIPEMISNHLVNPGNADELAIAIKKALNDKKAEKLDSLFLIENVVSEIRKVL